MAKSKVWPAPPSATSFKLHLVVHEIDRLPATKSADSPRSSSLMVQIEWRGCGRSGFLSKGFRRNYTSNQRIQSNGTVIWNEGFDKTVAKATIDVAEFAHPGNEKRIKIPIDCNIGGCVAEAVLLVELQVTEVHTGSSTPFSLPRARTLRSFSCTGSPQTHSFRLRNPTSGPEIDGTRDSRLSHDRSTYRSTSDSSCDDDPDFRYQRIDMTSKLDASKDPHGEVKQQPSLLRLFSRNRTKPSFKSADHSKSPPLLIKANGEDEGDDINNDRHHLQQTEPQPQENPQPSGFSDVGQWEKKVLVSRDGQMELVTDVLLASIDQRSEKAGGGSACTVLAAVIADWLHNNPKTLPSRCQLDELVHEGSSKWRKLCANEDHKEKFSDQHFDLDTVLEAKVRPLSVVTEMSYIGFFSLDVTTDSFEFLQGAMSFESIWEELLCTDASEERIYIASWNDHFFVLKVEIDAIYFIDTLGERLHEGCNQAYILRFNRESEVRRRSTKEYPDSGGLDEDHSSSQQVICKGLTSCKEYIKGFLAALPLRELQSDIERGLIKRAPLDRRLQIEFHYTTPCNMRFK